MRPITTRIVSKFQTTVPPEIRDIYELQEGDLLEWHFDEQSGEIRVVAMRPQSITPRMRELDQKLEAARLRAATPAREMAGSR